MDLITRRLLFLGLCIHMRTFIAFLPQFNNKLTKLFRSAKYVKVFYTLMSIVLLGIATGFLYLYFTNSRLEAPESGGKTWWHNLRFIHGLLYLYGGIMLLMGNKKQSSIALGVDTVIGLVAHLLHHYI